MKAWLAAALVVLAASCASPRIAVPRQDLSREIADDAAAFNEAYAQAVSGQILLNIMRSRDRLPRYYLATTGISDSPSWRHSQAAGVGSIPLGEGASPWGIGALSLQRETQSRPSYAVQPFSADTLTRTAFEPTAPHIFAHYWRSGWPRDLLLLVMVEAIEKTDAQGRHSVFTNEANTIFENCPARVETEGCAFVRELRAFLGAAGQRSSAAAIDLENGTPVCGLIDAYVPLAPVRPAPPAEGAICEPAFALGGDVVRFRLRSLDDMIYYIGELMRAGSMQAKPDGAIEAQVTIDAAGLRGGGRGVPLFRILPAEHAHGGHYAAEIAYAGRRYVAGPAIGRSCGEAAPHGVCADTAEAGDRSSSVLSLIAEILALNQSPDTIRAPSRLIAD